MAKDQEFLPAEGMAPVRNPKIHKKALAYATRRDARIAANKEEKDAHDTLLAAMLEEGIEDYVYGDLKVHVDLHRKCKVSSEPEGNGDGEE